MVAEISRRISKADLKYNDVQKKNISKLSMPYNIKPALWQLMVWYSHVPGHQQAQWWPNLGPQHNWLALLSFNTLTQRQNGRYFADDTFKCIFLNENVCIQIKISLQIVPKGPINNIPPLVQMMAWHWPGAKPLSESMMVRLLRHRCTIRPQWVKVRQKP